MSGLRFYTSLFIIRNLECLFLLSTFQFYFYPVLLVFLFFPVSSNKKIVRFYLKNHGFQKKKKQGITLLFNHLKLIPMMKKNKKHKDWLFVILVIVILICYAYHESKKSSKPALPSTTIQNSR